MKEVNRYAAITVLDNIIRLGVKAAKFMHGYKGDLMLVLYMEDAKMAGAASFFNEALSLLTCTPNRAIGEESFKFWVGMSQEGDSICWPLLL